MAEQDDQWFDEAAGPLVRPYAMTRGRTRPGRTELDLVTQVRVAPRRPDPASLTVDHLEIIELCRRPLSVAEVAAYLDVPLFVVKVLLSDLIERGDIVCGPTPQVEPSADIPLLQAVLNGLRNL
ncbi:DUF742 domain-containing protein [Amycolatopsis nigrescens]|uniref:DUF742 domain-containing protein n=1 Tax=Amycolatopsis nigrescens TaxID=381445 RepID=UPI00037CFB9C|nr:DUF742 domain-containing protein [Amycolatopsis nigrescens]